MEIENLFLKITAKVLIPDIVRFCLFQQKDSVWIADNGSRFDTIFLLGHIIQNKCLLPDVIMNGNKVMTMHIPFINATFLDNYLFLSMALSKFSKCLGFPNMTKGYHPYYFTDLSYLGEIVNLEYFDLSKMDERAKGI